MRRRVIRLALLGLLVLIAYEGWRVARAWSVTPQLFEVYAVDYQGLRWSDLSDRQQHILLAVEDPGFFDHPGIDLTTPGAGITTLTQSLVKRLYFDPFRPGFAKLEQSLIAVLVVENRTSKEMILTAFLDQAWFGGGVVGFEAAARVQFGKPVAELDDREFITLVARLIGPAHFTPGSQALAERVRRITRLLDGGCTVQSNGDVYYDTC